MFDILKFLGFKKETGKIKFMPASDIYERCVCCGYFTHIRRDTPIMFRDLYIEGVGQLCWSCYEEIVAEDLPNA